MLRNGYICSRGGAIQLNPEIEKVVHSQNRKETECSACGRFIGSWERCPFCRHWNPKRWQVRLIKYSTPILAILGLVLLSYMGKTYGVQPVQIKDLTRKSNYAQIQLSGRVSGDIRYHASDTDDGSGSLEFELDDGTDTIRIRAYDDVSAEVLAAGKVPGFGDQVVLTGSYQYKARRHFIILGSANDLEILREKPENVTPIGWLGDPEQKGLKAGQRVKVTGRIEDITSGKYDRRLTVVDPAGARTAISIPASVLEMGGADVPAVKFIDGLKAGDYVTCVGGLAQTKSRLRTWQVSPAAPAELAAADEQAWRNDNGNP
jgi:hypothetical protein